MALLRRLTLLLLLAISASALMPARGQDSAGASPGAKVQAEEYEIKAAYLYYFGLYTRWPAGAFTNAAAPFVVAVLGDDPFGEALERALSPERIRGRRIQIVRAGTGSAPPSCHLLFVAASERRRLEEILGAVKGKPVLTVGDFEQFCKAGGCIRFRKDGRNVKLVMNPGAIRAAGLRIDSELLQMATITESEEKK